MSGSGSGGMGGEGATTNLGAPLLDDDDIILTPSGAGASTSSIDDADLLGAGNERAGSPVRNCQRRSAQKEVEVTGNGNGDAQAMAAIATSPPPRQESDTLLQIQSGGIGGYGGVTMPQRKRPKRVSNYVLGPVMGVGTYGTVRDALDFSGAAARRVAIKVIRTKHRRAQELQRLREVLANEAHHLQRFHHANVIRAIDVFSDRAGKEYMVLPVAVCSLQQLIEARSHELQRRLSIGSFASNSGAPSSAPNNNSSSIAAPPPPPQQQQQQQLDSNESFGGSGIFQFTLRSLLPPQLTKDLVFQLLAGVHYLHSQGVCHSDLKFANALLFADGTVKITDLGSCSPKFNGRVNTPPYVSPIVARGIDDDGVAATVPSSAAAAVDGKANDVWAVGVMLYFLVTQRMPFDVGVPLNVPPLPDGVDPASEYALYHRIAHGEVNYSIVPEELGDASAAVASPSGGGGGAARPPFAPGTLRHLLSLLLERDQTHRATASQALHHPWLLAGEALKRRESNLTLVTSKSPEARLRMDTAPAVASPGAEETSVLLDLNISSGSLKRVFNVREISGVIDHDTKRHFQFVAEICHIVALPVPLALFGSGTAAMPQSVASLANEKGESSLSAAAREEKLRRERYSVFAGCVSRDAFMPVDEYNHYTRKGKPECDVKTFRFDPLKRASLQGYANRVFAFCGFDSSAAGTGGGAGGGGTVGRTGNGAGASNSSACWCCAMC